MTRGRVADSLCALAGTLGWLSVPKCPACLTVYLGAATGVGVSFAQGQALRMALLVMAGGLVVAGVWRLKRR